MIGIIIPTIIATPNQIKINKAILFPLVIYIPLMIRYIAVFIVSHFNPAVKPFSNLHA